MSDTLAVLVLEDGTVFYGETFGAIPKSSQPCCEGEVVFTTSMTGYQEICTDPSYRGQMVVMTYPLIGNYGIADDVESRRPWLAALIVGELCEEYSHWRAVESISSYLARYNILGMAGIDTRALTRHLRTYGMKRGIIHTYTAKEVPCREELIQKAKKVKFVSELKVVDEVALADPSLWQPALGGKTRFGAWATSLPGVERRPRVIIIDTGFKHNIARCLAQREVEVMLVPYTITLDEIYALCPDGIVLSNGPGDPEALCSLIELTQHLMTIGIPLMGICLGHQIIGLAAGAQTSRLSFGHHGANHPVKDIRTGKVTITSQNHNFQVEAATLPPTSGFHVSHINLLDKSVEGLFHEYYPIFSIQYHPEASPGPHDNLYLFDMFVAQVRSAMNASVS